MRERAWKWMIALLVTALLAGMIPGMAAESATGKDLIGEIGEERNGLKAEDAVSPDMTWLLNLMKEIADSTETSSGGDQTVENTPSQEPPSSAQANGYDASARDSFREISYDVGDDWTRFDVPGDWPRFTDPEKEASLLDYSGVDYYLGSITISIESEAVPAGGTKLTDMTAAEQMERLEYLEDRYIIVSNGSIEEETCDIAGAAALQVKTIVSLEDGDHEAMHYFFFTDRYYYLISFSDTSWEQNEEMQNVISQFLGSIEINPAA